MELKQHCRHLLQWLPLFIGPAMAKHFGPVFGSLGTLGIQCLTIAVDLRGVQERWATGKIASWPKSIHKANFAAWLCLLCFAAAGGASNASFAGHCGAASQSLVALFAFFSIWTGRPFTRELAVEQIPDIGRPMLEGSKGDGCEQLRDEFHKANIAAALVWALALTNAAAMQELGFNLYQQKSLGEIVFCHLAPPASILLAARQSYVLVRDICPMPIILDNDAVRIVHSNEAALLAS